MMVTPAAGWEQRAIEVEFPVGMVSGLAERESWRKEIHQPLSYLHKWWARRLGSVFRAALVGSLAPASSSIADLLRQSPRFPEAVVLDPFMGSGTTLYEALKLGCRVVGQDINPVAGQLVRSALERYDRQEVISTFQTLAETAGRSIRELYQARTPAGESLDVLYYFWVASLECPHCGSAVDILKSRVFAKHAYARHHPIAKALCPCCGAVNDVRHDATSTTCGECLRSYNPQEGNSDGTWMTCGHCGHRSRILENVQRSGHPPRHRMYAKMVLHPTGEKAVLRADSYDSALFARAALRRREVEEWVPDTPIKPGHNTNQILNYRYERWADMFNDRQIACLGILASAIARIPEPSIRDLFAILFSGTLEFNNMLTSFKGFGTGAVRHLFSHHILKPEMTPLEANLWGTSRSSGAFSTLFETRILRALEYRDRALCPSVRRRSDADGQKESGPKRGPAERSYLAASPDSLMSSSVPVAFVATGDSSATELASNSVDVVVTDPPFFDNVHYSELADFFYVWLRKLLTREEFASETTRNCREVQTVSAEQFTQRLGDVFRECRRVLKPGGLLVFTYHHSRTEGWTSVYRAIREAGFVVVKAHPVKAEMAVSVPIQQAKEPCNYDVILVCRRSEETTHALRQSLLCLDSCVLEASRVADSLLGCGLPVTIGDARIILTASLLPMLASGRPEPPEIDREVALLRHWQAALYERVGEVIRGRVPPQLSLAGI